MPVKKLPEKLVRRLEKAIRYGEEHSGNNESRVDGVLRSLEKIDPRPIQSFAEVDSINAVGGRVRKLDVHNKHPEIGEVILKHTHQYFADDTIMTLQAAVVRHNQKFPNEEYDLLIPQGVVLRDDLIATSKATFLIDEREIDELKDIQVRDLNTLAFGPKTMLDREKTLKAIQPYGFTPEKIKDIEKTIRGKIILEGVEEGHKILESSNLLVVGIKKGKLQLVPAMDLY